MIAVILFLQINFELEINSKRAHNNHIHFNTQDSALCKVIQNMLSSRRFYVEVKNDHSRWRNQKNGCLSPTNVKEIYLLAGIASPDIRRGVCGK